MAKLMLILRCSEHEDEISEIENIRIQAKLYGIEPIVEESKNADELYQALNKGIRYDFIYLSAHGDEYGFSNESGSLNYRWSNFGELLHNLNCLNDDCYLLLSCCKGGLNDVAFDLINFCKKLQYVVGPRMSLYPEEILIGFNLFLYHVAFKQNDPIIACDKIKSAIDLRFVCYDRVEIATEPAYLIRANNYEIFKVDLNNDGIEDEIIIKPKIRLANLATQLNVEIYTLAEFLKIDGNPNQKISTEQENLVRNEFKGFEK